MIGGIIAVFTGLCLLTLVAIMLLRKRENESDAQFGMCIMVFFAIVIMLAGGDNIDNHMSDATPKSSIEQNR